MIILNNPKKLKNAAKQEIIKIDWTMLEAAIDTFIKKINKIPNFDCLFVLVRGAMVPAVMLSHRLNQRNLSFYQGIKTYSNTPHDYGKFYEKFKPKITKGTRYLIIEDIIFEGDTITNAMDYIHKSGGKIVGIVSLVIDENFKNLPQFNNYQIPIIAKWECANLKWIRFPWEKPLNGEKPPLN